MERRRSKNRGLRGKKMDYENMTAGVQNHTQVLAVPVLESAPEAQPNVQSEDACPASSVDSFPELPSAGQEERVKRSCQAHYLAGPSHCPDPKRRFPDQRALSSWHPSTITTLYMASECPARPNAQPQLANNADPRAMEDHPQRGEKDEGQDHSDEDDDGEDDEVVVGKGWRGAVRGRNEKRGATTPLGDQRGQRSQQQKHHHSHHLHHPQQQQEKDHQLDEQELNHAQQQEEQNHPKQHIEQNHQQEQQEQNHQQQQQEQNYSQEHLHPQQRQQQDLQQNPHPHFQLQQPYHQYHLLQHQPQHRPQDLHLHGQHQHQQPHLFQQLQHQHQQRQPNPHQQEEHQRQEHHGQCQQQAARSRLPRGKAVRQSQQTQQAACEQTVLLPPQSPVGISGTQSDSAISGQEITNEQRLFYGAHIGSETRNVEFKRGGGEYLRSTFRSHLRRYACAFLNSGGGMLLVGVDDDGVVRGLRCDHRQEDRARLLVDSTLKFFQPPLLPHCYSLSFLTVVRPGPEGIDLKVLRLVLQPPPAHTQLALYQTDMGEVFMRRDGSVEGPLSASAIQEWARQRWSGEVTGLQRCVQVLLAEQRLLLQEVRQQSLTIAALQRAQMPPVAPAPPPNPVTQHRAALPPAAPPPRPEGLRDRLLKGKLCRRVSLAQTPPQTLSGCPSRTDAPSLVAVSPSVSQDPLRTAVVVNAQGGLPAAQERGSWVPQNCERMWGDMEDEGLGRPQYRREAGAEPAGAQTPVSAACVIM